MPRGSKILGKPIDEEKWAQAKARAAEEGQSGNYAYIMSIYKKMIKSSIDTAGKLCYPKNRDIRLVLAKAKNNLDEFRCGTCRALLFKGQNLYKSFIEVRCKRCSTLNINQE